MANSAVLSLTEWQNLLSELKRIADRYGEDAINEALKYMQVTSGKGRRSRAAISSDA